MENENIIVSVTVQPMVSIGSHVTVKHFFLFHRNICENETTG